MPTNFNPAKLPGSSRSPTVGHARGTHATLEAVPGRNEGRKDAWSKSAALSEANRDLTGVRAIASHSVHDAGETPRRHFLRNLTTALVFPDL